MPKTRTKSLDQISAMKAKAVRFVRDVLGDPERAEEIDGEEPESYAARKGISVLENPRRRRTEMVRRPTRNELEDRVHELEEEVDALNEKLDSISEIASDGDEGESDDEEGD